MHPPRVGRPQTPAPPVAAEITMTGHRRSLAPLTYKSTTELEVEWLERKPRVIESVPVGGAHICFPLTDGPRRWYTLYPTKKTNESLLTGPERCILRPNAHRGCGDSPLSRSRRMPPRPGADELETDPLATHFIHSDGSRQWP